MDESLLSFFRNLRPSEWARIVADLGIVFFLLYRTLLLMKGTRAVQMLVGLALLFVFYFVSKDEYLGLPTLNWLLDNFIGSFIIILIIIFQEDIRRALSQVGRNPVLATASPRTSESANEEVVRAVGKLASKRIGALMVMEREADLGPYAEKGVKLDAAATRELLFSMFIPSFENPLHDGAAIVSKDKVTAGGVVLPLSENPNLDRSLGTRHRAALGISEITDAVVVVVSEETGIVSLVEGGRMRRGLDPNELRDELQRLFRPEARLGFFSRLFRRGVKA